MSTKARSLIYLGLIFSLAFYLRLRFVLYTPFELKIDAWSMYHYSLNVVEGQYYGHRFGEHWARYAYWPPLYIFLSGFIYRFLGTSQDFLVMRLIQVLFSTASCLLCYCIANISLRRYSSFHREAGLAAGILMALNPRMVVYTNHLYVETVFITLYLAAAYYALRYSQVWICTVPTEHKAYRTLKQLIPYSLLLGIGNLTRPVLLLIPFVMAVFLLLLAAASRLRLKQSLAAILKDTVLSFLIMLTVFSPWIIRNHAVTGRFILIDTNGPINFYIAHNPLAKGQWVDVKPHTDINRLYDTGYRDGLAYILRNIPREIELSKLKQRLFLYEGDPHISEASAYLDRTYRLPLYGSLITMGIAKKDALEGFYKLPQMTFTALWISFILLLLLFVLRLAAAGALRILFCEPAWIIGNILYINLIIQLFYFAPRYRIIAEPFLCIALGVFAAAIVTPALRIFKAGY